MRLATVDYPSHPWMVLMSVPAADKLRARRNVTAASSVVPSAFIVHVADLLDAIDALHQPVSRWNVICAADGMPWPCQTAELLHPEEARRER